MRHTYKSRIKGTLGAVALSVLLSAPATAGPNEDAFAAYRAGDYALALKLYRPLAEQGDGVAQLGLALMYHNGNGVPQDYAVAAKWARLLARPAWRGPK